MISNLANQANSKNTFEMGQSHSIEGHSKSNDCMNECTTVIVPTGDGELVNNNIRTQSEVEKSLFIENGYSYSSCHLMVV